MTIYNITANFQESKILGKIMFESVNLKFTSLGKGDNAIMQSLFNTEVNPHSVGGYADGTHATPEKVGHKVDIWGSREEKGEALRAFFVYKNNDEANPIGFVNLGVNGLNINNLEIGVFFNDKTLSDNMALATEAVSTVAKDYPAYIKSTYKLLPEKQFVFYDASYEPLKEVAKSAGFTQINNLDELCRVFGEGTNSDNVNTRFSFSEQDGILDEGRAVSAFYYKLEPEVVALGLDSDSSAAAASSSAAVSE